MKTNRGLFAAAFLYLFSIILFYAGSAQAAGIAVDKMVIEFSAGKRPVENVNVTNQSDKPLKVASIAIQVIGAGQDGEADQPTDKLVVAPKTFELAPGETRAVRLVIKDQPGDMESIYRVRFTPSEPSFYKGDETGKTSVRVAVVVAMGVLVMVHPKDPKPDLKVARKGDKIEFKNDGNVTAQLQREEFCTEDRKSCAPLNGKRIYPGAKWEMEVPEALKGKPFEQTVLINGSYSKLSYPVN